jgi:hypothetical protein
MPGELSEFGFVPDDVELIANAGGLEQAALS